jgi:hypothetical protein
MSDEIDDERVVALQSLSNAQLIQILQFHDGDDALTQMVEAELSKARPRNKDRVTGDQVENTQYKLGAYGGGTLWYLRNRSRAFIQFNRLHIAKLEPDGKTWEALAAGWKITARGAMSFTCNTGIATE